MNSSTGPDETVNRSFVVLLGFATFFIFPPPEFPDLIVEPLSHYFVYVEPHGSWFPIKVPMMVAVTIVVAEDTPMSFPHTAGLI